MTVNGVDEFEFIRVCCCCCCGGGGRPCCEEDDGRLEFCIDRFSRGINGRIGVCCGLAFLFDCCCCC